MASEQFACFLNRGVCKYHLAYLEIPNNEKKFLDVIFKNATVGGEKTDIGVLYIENLVKGEIVFLPSIDQLAALSDYNADAIINGENLDFEDGSAAENWLKNRFN